MVSVRSLAGSLFALALMALPAKALTFVSAGGSVANPVVGELYALVGGTGPGGTITGDTFTFNFTGALIATATAVTLDTNGQSTGKGIASLSYVFETYTSDKPISDALGNSLTPSNPLTLLSSVVTTQLIVKVFGGPGLSPLGGTYQVSLNFFECTDNCGGQVPLPGAVFLFGSVLAGGVGGMQLMRRRRMARVA